MNKILFIIMFIIVFIISLIKSFQNKYINNYLTNLIYPLNYIKYNNLRKKYKIINKDIPIYIFYHLCPKSNDNIKHKIIIDEQMNDLVKSGLYNKCHMIFCGCNCHNCDNFLDDYLIKYSKMKKMDNAICPDKNTFENMTINSMLKFSKTHKKNFYGLYLHTKGTTSVSESQHNWRKFMMFYLVKNYKLCIDLLNRGFYTCGINYLNNPKHYSGNFFWFNSKYLKKLNYIEDVENRMSAEFWLFSNYVKNKHISICRERYINIILFNIKFGLYYFSNNYKKNIKDMEIAII